MARKSLKIKMTNGRGEEVSFFGVEGIPGLGTVCLTASFFSVKQEARLSIQRKRNGQGV